MRQHAYMMLVRTMFKAADPAVHAGNADSSRESRNVTDSAAQTAYNSASRRMEDGTANR
jgi:hypothetical protein